VNMRRETIFQCMVCRKDFDINIQIQIRKQLMCFLNCLCRYHTYSFFLARYVDGDGTNYRPDHLGQDSTQHGHDHGRPSQSSLGMVTVRCLAFTDVPVY
jgi:hypothetical protein